MYYQNVRGLKTKLSELRLSLAMSQYDVIVLTETWLDETVSDGELSFDGYQIHRCDRDFAATGKSQGGGVLICVRFGIDCEVLHPSNLLQTCEELWLSLSVKGVVDIVGAIYIPPAADVSVYEQFCASVETFMQRFPAKRLLCCGDFNLPGISWTNDCLGVNCVGANGVSRPFIECLSYLNLFQKNVTPNIYGTTLDLMLTNCDDLCCDIAACVLLKCDNYHPALECAYISDLENILITDELSFNFSMAEYDQIEAALCNISWDSLFFYYMHQKPSLSVHCCGLCCP